MKFWFYRDVLERMCCLAKLIDIAGQKFGRLTPIRRDISEHINLKNGTKMRGTRWMCLCECGNTVSVLQSGLKRGTTSCGCVWREIISIHNMTGTDEHKAWLYMKVRCRKDCSKSDIYFYKGVRLDERWEKFENFFKDMGIKPNKKSYLDRIDSDKNYSKANCRWVTPQQSSWNTGKRRNCSSIYKGVSFNKRVGKYTSIIMKDGKSNHLGYFDKEDDAGRAYNKMALKLFGEYAWLNDIDN